MPSKIAPVAKGSKSKTITKSSQKSFFTKMSETVFGRLVFIAVFIIVGAYLYHISNAATPITAYSNPFRSAHITSSGRVDQGVDFSGTGKVYAIGPGQIIEVKNPATAGWDGGWFIAEKLSTGRAANKIVYIAEDCTPNVKQGETVKMSDVVCTMYNGQTGIEIGWAEPPQNGDIAMAHDEYAHEGYATSFGQNFSQFLAAIGAPHGNIGKSDGVSHTHLPKGWPTW